MRPDRVVAPAVTAALQRDAKHALQRAGPPADIEPQTV
jgi:hypothetical protein